MRQQPDKSIDLIFTSPPYEDARTYGIDFKLKGQDWVDWAVERYKECVRVCRGLTAWVVEGKTRQFRWSATPALMMADLHRAGVKLRKPPLYVRHGIPGSGGPDWLKNRYEFVVCATHGKLPWSDNTATGKPPKYGVGGVPTHRMQNGERVNARRISVCKRVHDGSGEEKREYQNFVQPELANPGNLVDCGSVGGGNIGHRLASENEAPFPEKLVEFFIRSFCPPDGVVADPFCGSGTTCCVAKKWGRQYIGIDCRQSQIDLTQQRLSDPMYDLESQHAAAH